MVHSLSVPHKHALPELKENHAHVVLVQWNATKELCDVIVI